MIAAISDQFALGRRRFEDYSDAYFLAVFFIWYAEACRLGDRRMT